MSVIFLNGMPGTGKTTMAEILLLLSPLETEGAPLSIEHMSIGDTLRALASGGLKGSDVDDLSETILPYAELIKQAKPIPHHLVLEIVAYRLQTRSRDKTLIIDGFPRFSEQIPLLEKILLDTDIHSVIQFILRADDTTVKQRIMARGKRSGEQGISEEFLDYRLSEYYVNVLPALTELGKIDNLTTYEIDASTSKLESLLQILQCLQSTIS